MAALSTISVGSIVKIKENGTAQEFYVASHGYPASGRTLLVRRYIYDERRMSKTLDDLSYDYDNSELDVWLNNTYLPLLPADIRGQIAAVSIKIAWIRKYYDDGEPIVVCDTNTISRKVFILSAKEMGGSAGFMENDGTILPTPAVSVLKIAKNSAGAASQQWTRSPRIDRGGSALVLSVSGAFATSGLTVSNGTRPAFTLPSTISVDSSGNVTLNQAPPAPASITIPASVVYNAAFTVSWAAVSDPDGNAVTYRLERSTDSGSWTQVYSGAALSWSQAALGRNTATTVNYRVKATDGSLESAYRTGTARTVVNNLPPVLSYTGSTALGTKNEGFTVAYAVSDTEGGAVTVAEKLDGVTMRTHSPATGTSQQFAAVLPANYQTVLNGSHTLTVEATDGSVSAAPVSVTFTKAVHTATVTLSVPLRPAPNGEPPAAGGITKMFLRLVGSIPNGAVTEALATNNAADPAPVWEDISGSVTGGHNHLFANATAANGAAFNFKVTVSRAPGNAGGYISGIVGGFE